MSEIKTHFGYQSIPVEEKTARVAEVFHSVASNYDLMNDLMSFGLHRLWKRVALARAQIEPQHQVLDLACGSGDLSLKLAEKIKDRGGLCLSDINDSMLARARNRLTDEGYVKGLEYIQANAEALPFPDNAFDRVLMGFGLRNVTFKEKALAEIYRVLKPGARAIILEFSQPKNTPLKSLYDTYSFSVLPWLGKVICKDEDSYRYLAESIRMHPDQEALKEMMNAAKFEQVSYQNILDGIVALHIGHKFS